MNFKFCPNCGTKGSVVRDNSTEYHCDVCDKEFWNDPKATASAIFLKDGQALFAQRAIEPNKGKYDFPGGFLKYNEDLYEGCAREIREESGVIIKPEDMQLLTGYAREYIPGSATVDLLLIVKKWEGEFKPADDVAALEWKPIDFIKSDQFAPREYTDLVERLASFI